MIRVLSDADVANVLDIADLLPVVADAFRAQYRGEVERPDRPHFPVGFHVSDNSTDGAESAAGMGLTMPAYIHGRDVFTTKLASVHEGNVGTDLPTVNAQIAVTNANNGQPEAFLHGTRITNARTGCIGGLAVRELTSGPITLAIIGAGTQARWQARAIHAATDIDQIRVYSPSDSRERCAADLQSDRGVPADSTNSASIAVTGADVVVTATTSTTPVIQADALEPDALVVAIGAYNVDMQELPPGVFARAETVFADVPEEVVDIGDIQATALTSEDLVPFGALLSGTGQLPDDGGDTIRVVESIGSAVLDAATAEYVLDRAMERDIGTRVQL